MFVIIITQDRFNEKFKVCDMILKLIKKILTKCWGMLSAFNKKQTNRILPWALHDPEYIF